MNHRIKDVYWLNCAKWMLVGCVLVETLPEVYKCYLWPVKELPPWQERDEEEDKNFIYAFGAKVMPHIAKAFFPHAANFTFYEE